MRRVEESDLRYGLIIFPVSGQRNRSSMLICPTGPRPMGWRALVLWDDEHNDKVWTPVFSSNHEWQTDEPPR